MATKGGTRTAVVGAGLAWRRAGAVAPWTGRFHTLRRGALGPDPRPDTRFVGAPRMSSLARHLAEGLDVRTRVRIASVEPGERGWRLATEDGAVHDEFARVVVATPAPQAARLLAAHPPLAQVAALTALQPCQAVMVTFAAPLDAPFDGAFVEDSPLAWAARQASKPCRADAPSFVLHASAAWSDAHRDDPPNTVASQLLDAFAEALQRPLPAVVHCAAHRWLYARASRPANRDCLWDAATGLGACGDWLLGARVEAAVRSGLALADAVHATG